jgi:hypothetical protein
MIAVRDELKKELVRLEKLRVLQPVDVPTNWVSALVMARKKDGRIRMCIGPKHLNQALKRNMFYHRNGFWQLVELDEERCYNLWWDALGRIQVVEDAVWYCTSSIRRNSKEDWMRHCLD